MHAVVHSADIHNRDGGVLVMTTLFGLYPFLRKLYADGGYQGPPFQAAMKRTLAGRAAETYVLASAEKIGAASAYRVLPVAGVTGIITDARRGDATVRALRRAGVRVLSAPSARGR